MIWGRGKVEGSDIYSILVCMLFQSGTPPPPPFFWVNVYQRFFFFLIYLLFINLYCGILCKLKESGKQLQNVYNWLPCHPFQKEKLLETCFWYNCHWVKKKMTYDSEGIYFTFHNITDCRSFFTLTFPTCFQIVTDCLEEIFFWIRFWEMRMYEILVMDYI